MIVHAITAAQVRRPLAFGTRMQVDAFSKEHEVYDFTAADFERIAKRFVSSARERLSAEPALEMDVVADTSPINYLVLIAQIDFL
jgi:hypothetical protein